MPKFDLLPQIEAEMSAKMDPYMPALRATLPPDGQWHRVQMYGRVDATGNVYLADFVMDVAANGLPPGRHPVTSGNE